MIDKYPDYEVGYGKPPKQHRFQSGQSGNPKGRPKKRNDMPSLMNQELNKKIRVKDQGEVRTITKLEAMMASLMARAIQGDYRAVKLVMELKRQYIDPDEFEDGVDVESIVMDYLNRDSNSKGAENEE